VTPDTQLCDLRHGSKHHATMSAMAQDLFIDGGYLRDGSSAVNKTIAFYRCLVGVPSGQEPPAVR
jgi:hypothetical protein